MEGVTYFNVSYHGDKVSCSFFGESSFRVPLLDCLSSVGESAFSGFVGVTACTGKFDSVLSEFSGGTFPDDNEASISSYLEMICRSSSLRFRASKSKTSSSVVVCAILWTTGSDCLHFSNMLTVRSSCNHTRTFSRFHHFIIVDVQHFISKGSWVQIRKNPSAMSSNSGHAFTFHAI